MTTPAIHDGPDAFGQRGVRALARPVIVGCCAVSLAISAAMWSRSQHNWDVLWRAADDRSIEIGSILGRLMITTRGLNPASAPQGSAWTYESQEFSAMPDGWSPSIWKTIGIDWGYERSPGRRGVPIEYWRFRLAWRTACLVSIAPIVVDAVLRRRGRHRRARAAADADQVA